jgi:DNA-binding MarR family transcriptional regulator
LYICIDKFSNCKEMEIESEIKSTVALADSKKVLLNIIFCSNMLQEKMNEILKPFDLSSEQYNVLRILRGQKGVPSNMSTIQERMIAKTSNTTRLVDKLLIKKMVTRCTCESNRRKIEVSITQKGLDVLTSLDQLVINHEENFSKNLDQIELKTLNTLLEQYRSQK